MRLPARGIRLGLSIGNKDGFFGTPELRKQSLLKVVTLDP